MTGKTPQNIVIFNVFGHLNMGDAMLVESLVDIIRERYPQAQLSGLAFDVESQRLWMPDIAWTERVATKVGGRGLPAKARQAFTLLVALAIASNKNLFFLRYLLPSRQREGLEALARADIAFSCPGGYLEDSNRAYLLNMLQVMLAARLSKKVIFAPQSVGPVRSSFGRRVIASVLRHIDKVFVREQSSMAFVTELHGSKPRNVEQSGDLAFWYHRAPEGIDEEWIKIGVDPSKPILGMTILYWNFPHASDPETAEQAYLSSLSSLVDIAISDGYQVVIFNQVASDLPTIGKFEAINDRAIIDRGERSCGKLAAMIAQCEIFIGSRFHSCIFGLIGGVPTGAIAYLPKTSGIMKDLGLSRYVTTIDDLTPERVFNLYDTLRRDPQGIAEQIRTAVAHYREENNAFVAYLANDGTPAS
jgi:colanic acid/amylovoran biosynthesis protein